jgi:hypothetical protein
MLLKNYMHKGYLTPKFAIVSSVILCMHVCLQFCDILDFVLLSCERVELSGGLSDAKRLCDFVELGTSLFFL